jgi:predicted RNA-binding Zn-ribbon protein involved in translation (DUF1610 family)
MTENTLLRSTPCPECGAQMMWTQNAWRSNDVTQAAYRCPTGHLLDPATTRQCPACGLHDTTVLSEADGQQYRCLRCNQVFHVPR